MKHSIRLTGPNGAHVYLSHRGKTQFAPATARKYLTEWLACNPGGVARIENQFREPVKSAPDAPALRKLETTATRVYKAGCLTPSELSRVDVRIMEKLATLETATP